MRALRQGRLMLCIIIYGGVAFLLLITWAALDGDRRFER